MKIVVITPAQARSRSGNRATAERWAAHLRGLGHEADVQVEWDGEPVDLMVALHARKSWPSIAEHVLMAPTAPMVLMLTGTDLYRDIRTDDFARASLDVATRIVVLQDQAPLELEPELRERTRVIFQSAAPMARGAPLKSAFEVCVVGHLRDEKDPFRAAHALPLLPAGSRVVVAHFGAALSAELAAQAWNLAAREPRYRWYGELPHYAVRRRMARARLMIVSSLMEGGANVICESVMSDVPVLASHVPGNVGMLGVDYDGYFAAGDERALAALLARAESDAAFFAHLEQQCRARRPLFEPAHEREAIGRLVDELAASAPLSSPRRLPSISPQPA